MINPNFAKYKDGLVPVIVQDASTKVVLMLGFMNCEALAATIDSGKVTFFSRTKNSLWIKGETSGNFLFLRELKTDCDNDTLLALVDPFGPVCHTGADTCFNEKNSYRWVDELEKIIESRRTNPSQQSYVASLFDKGISD